MAEETTFKRRPPVLGEIVEFDSNKFIRSGTCIEEFFADGDPETQIDLSIGTKIQLLEGAIWLWDASGCLSKYQSPLGIVTKKGEYNNYKQDNWYCWELCKARGRIIYIP